MTGVTAPEWLDRKACRPEQAALFWPGGNRYEPGLQGSAGVDYGPALAICRSCSAVAECRADIVDGHTTHGQVVGGCAPKQVAKGERMVLRRPCALPGCFQWFSVTGPGANLYCSPECAAAARKVSRSRQRRAS